MVDKWNSLAVLLADLIEKHAADLDIDSLPNPVYVEKESETFDTDKKIQKKDIATETAA